MSDQKPVTINLFVLDRSDSMESIQDATIQGFNEVLTKMQEEQRDHPEEDHRLVLVIFNHKVSVTVYDCDVGKVVRLDHGNYVPSGSTALNDATGFGVREVQNRFGTLIEAGQANVLATIFTDGYENASNHFNQDQIRSLIEELRATKKWGFVYFGSTGEAKSQARDMGIGTANAINFAAASGGAFAAMNANNHVYSNYVANTRMARGRGQSMSMHAMDHLADDAGVVEDDLLNAPDPGILCSTQSSFFSPAGGGGVFRGREVAPSSDDPYRDAVRSSSGLSAQEIQTSSSGVTIQVVT